MSNRNKLTHSCAVISYQQFIFLTLSRSEDLHLARTKSSVSFTMTENRDLPAICTLCGRLTAGLTAPTYFQQNRSHQLPALVVLTPAKPSPLTIIVV